MTPAITAQMVARSRALADPRWAPAGTPGAAPSLAWVDSFAGRADIIVAPGAGGDETASVAVVVTADVPAARTGSAFAWTPGGREIVYAAGDGRLLAVPATGGPVRVLSREGRAAAPAVSPDGTRVAFVLERNDACDIAVVPLDGSAWPVRVSAGADWAFDPSWAPGGRTLAWHEWDFPDMPWDASRIVLRHIDGCTPAGAVTAVAGGDGVAAGQPRFAPDGSRLAYLCDRTGFMNVWVARADGQDATVLLDEPFEHAEPTWGPGQRSFAWAPDSRAVAVCRNEGGFGRLVVVPADGSGPARAVSKGWHHGLDWGGGGLACVRSGSCTPPQVTTFTGGFGPDSDGTRRPVAQGAPGALTARGVAVEPEAVTWTGDDGAQVHGLLYRPGTSALGAGTRPPLLVSIHGGPTGSAGAAWRPQHLYWLSRGWAILAPNYRGSTGYGRRYSQALSGRWGELDVADVAAGIRHAAGAAWGDLDRVALIGGSAGGFTLLLLAARHPELVRAGVDLFGVTDLFALAETTHRYESRYLDRVVGPLPEAADRYRDRSPVTHAERITVPLLVLQGDRDETVPKAQADALVDVLRRRGSPVEYHVYENEGHGWSRPETVADELERTDRFLTRWVLKR